MAYLLGLIPSVRGVIGLAILGAIGGWIGGERGATLALVTAVALSFLKPNLSMWLESILFAVRTACFAMAAFRAIMFLSPLSGGPSQLKQALVFGTIGAIAQIRIWWLLQRRQICPLALGSST